MLVLVGLGSASSAGAIGFLDQWGSGGTGPGKFGFPIAVAVDKVGRVYVADSQNNRIERFSGSGAFLGQWGSEGSGDGELAAPESVALDGGGNVYVADTGNNRVEKFTSGGDFLTQWGGSGSGPGQFASPEGIAVDATGNVYVADTDNDRIEKFTGSGAFLGQWGIRGSGNGEFDSPEGVEIDSVGNVYVADAGNNRVEKFALGGDFLTQWGSAGSGPGQFHYPVDVAVRGARVYVVDSGNDRIEVFGKLPEPRFGKTVNIALVSGKVRVRLAGTHKFVLLTSDMQIPIGSSIDATHGRVRLSSAKNRHGGTQTADFYAGGFKVLQPLGGKPITVLALQGAIGPCGKGRHQAAASRSRRRSLWGSGHGNFRSEGHYGSATVRGTIWLTQDRCDGTFFSVKRGIVTIKDFTSHRTVKIPRGKHYLAPAG